MNGCRTGATAPEPTHPRLRRYYQTYAQRHRSIKSDLYAELAEAIAADDASITMIASLPESKRRPQLLFAAYRFLFGVPANWPEFHDRLHQHREEILTVLRARTVQANEPARCATLMPVLSRLRPPLSLVEVGASAGLCLLPDYYAYDFGAGLLPPAHVLAVSAPQFVCSLEGTAEVPTTPLQVSWRAGLDLAPIDLDDPDQLRWLEAFVWPGKDEQRRLRTLRLALDVARAARPRVVTGDLADELPTLLASAPSGTTTVVVNCNTLTYLSPAERQRFAATARTAADHWISNEAHYVFPQVTSRLCDPTPRGQSLIALDGEPVGWTDLLGERFVAVADPGVSPR